MAVPTIPPPSDARLGRKLLSFYPSSHLTNEGKWMVVHWDKEKNERERLNTLCSAAWKLPDLRGRKEASKSIIAWSHISMENSSDICLCRHVPAFQPATHPTAFQSFRCSCFHLLQWRKRCSRVWDAYLHHQHWPSSCSLNCLRYVAVGACLHFIW